MRYNVVLQSRTQLEEALKYADLNLLENAFEASKREGAGIGVASVREIAARYGGAAQFEHRDGIFYASVRLMLPNHNAS